MLKKKIEGVTVPRPPPTWLCPRHERKLRGQTTNHFHPGPRVLFVLFPTPWVPPLFPDVPPPNDLHAANRQNEPIIAAFVIFPPPPSSSPPPRGGEKRASSSYSQFVSIGFLVLLLPASFSLAGRTTLLLSVSRVEVTSYCCIASSSRGAKEEEGRTIRNGTDTVADLLDFAFWTDGFLFVSCSFSLRPGSRRVSSC